jgi:hypothetical protein
LGTAVLVLEAVEERDDCSDVAAFDRRIEQVLPDLARQGINAQQPAMPFALGRSWHFRDIARSPMDFRFRRKSGRAADITVMTELTPSGLREHSRDLPIAL